MAVAIGRSVSLTCKLRNRKRRERAKEIPLTKKKWELRNRAATTLAREAALLDQVLTEAGSGGIVVIPNQRVLAGSVDVATAGLSFHSGPRSRRCSLISMSMPMAQRASRRATSLTGAVARQ